MTTGLSPDLGLILDSLPQSVLVTNKNNRVLYANFTAETMFGSSAANMKKHRLDQFLPFGSPVLELVKQVLNQRAPVNGYQIDISTPRIGDGRIVDVYAAPLADNSPNAILLFRERSMADRIDKQLSHRSAARSVTGLAAMLAHEIKNPLSGIRGAAQLLEGVIGTEDKKLAQLITSETDRIVKLVDKMEVFSDETPVEQAPVNMHSILGHVRRIAENGFARHVKIIENYDPSLPDVSGSGDQLIQVFLNLIKNATEAIPEGRKGVITLSSAYRSGIKVASPGSGERASLPLEFTVKDNGKGISEDMIAHVFEPFVTTRINGSGLGLALVAKTIGRHGGIIECDSAEGRGTTFKILLPAWKTRQNTTENSGVAENV